MKHLAKKKQQKATKSYKKKSGIQALMFVK